MINTIISLLVAHSAPGAVAAKPLALAIIQVANAYGEDPILITQIILVESRGKALAYNSKTQDYGLMQINIKTAAAMHLDTACLFNWRCNLKVGVEILSKLNRPCRFNVGTKTLKGKRLENCLHYESKLASMEITTN